MHPTTTTDYMILLSRQKEVTGYSVPIHTGQSIFYSLDSLFHFTVFSYTSCHPLSRVPALFTMINHCLRFYLTGNHFCGEARD